MNKFIKNLGRYTVGTMIVIFLNIFINANTFVPEALKQCNGSYSEVILYTFLATLWIGFVFGWIISSIFFTLDNL